MEVNKHLGWIYPKDQDVASMQDIRDIINSQKGQNGGIATLDNNGKISSSQLPSYVDDVLEYNDKASFPETGEESKIYVDKTTNHTYRWSGSTYILIGGVSNLLDGSTFGSVRGVSAQIENNEYSLGANAIALGYMTKALGISSVAEGYYSEAREAYSHVEGQNTIASEESSHAEGSYTTALGNSSHAEGVGTTALGHGSHAQGYNTEAKEAYSHAQGVDSIAFGANSHAEGSRTRAVGPRSHAEGKDTFAAGEASHVEGYSDYSQMERKSFSVAANSSNMILTNATSASPGDSYILYIPILNQYFFIKTKASDNKTLTLRLLDSDSTYVFNNALTNVYCYICYDYSIAVGQGSHAEGKNTHAIGEYSHAQGKESHAEGQSSHAEGSSYAEGQSSHAEGSSHALGSYSHAEGFYNQTKGYASHAQGYNTEAREACSHTEGEYTLASGIISHAEGDYTRASGDVSHAEGAHTRASGNVSHAQNDNTIAAGDYQTSLGQYNKEDETAYVLTQDVTIDENKTYYIKRYDTFTPVITPDVANISTYYEYQPFNSDYAVIIGNGTSDTARSNALAVKWDGNVEIAGTPTENNHVVTKGYVDNAISNVDAMTFKGTLGVNGTVTQLPTTGVHIGDTYRVITAGTYAGLTCSVGDLIIATATTPTWTLAPTNTSGAITQIIGTAPVQVSNSGSSSTISVNSASNNSAGLMSANDKTKLDGITAGAEVNRTYTAVTGKPTTNQIPSFGDNVTISQISQSSTGQITATDKIITIPNSLASTSSNGLMSSEDKTKLNNIATGAQVNRTYSAITGKPTENQTPSFGDSITISQISQNSTGQIATADKTITIPNTIATTSIAGLMSASDKTKLDGIDSGAQVNPNSLSAASGGTTVSLVTTGEKYTWNNKVSGSGTSGYIAKFNGDNSITSGPQIGTATNTYLRNDGTWAVPYSLPVTKSNTLGGVKPFRNHTVVATGPTATATSAAVVVNNISSTSGKYYAIESDSNGRLFVNVPWTNTTGTYITDTMAFQPNNRTGGEGFLRKWSDGRTDIFWKSASIGSVDFKTSQSSGKWYTNSNWISWEIRFDGDLFDPASPPLAFANIQNNGYLINNVSGVGYDSSNDEWIITIRALSLDSRTFNLGQVNLYVTDSGY